MSKTPQPEEDAWYARIDCPRYFDFSAALQAPCSLDLQYNPPLHDFVYESDEESSAFFRRAEASPPSPHPKRVQQRMLDPRHFGNPIYRHRPEMTFEEFLQRYQQRRRRQRQSLQANTSASAKTSEHTSASPQSPPPSSDHLSRYKSLPNKEATPGPGLFKRADAQIPREQDRSVLFKTPSGDRELKTPSSNRRRAQQYTPSRVQNPSHIVKSLFFTPSSPSPSPLRKARRRPQGVPQTSSDPPHRPLPSPLRLTPKIPEPNSEASTKASGAPSSVVLRPPARTTPPTNPVGSASSTDSKSGSRTVQISESIVDRRDKKTPDAPGLPRRTIRPFGSNTSSSTVTPPVSEAAHNVNRNDPKSVAKEELGPGSSATEKKTDPSMQELSPRPRPLSQREKVNITFQVPEAPKEEGKGAGSDDAEIDDPDLLRILKEHNRRLRKSGRHVPKDILDAISDTESQTEQPSQTVPERNDLENGANGIENTDPHVAPLTDDNGDEGKEGQLDTKKRQGQSLQDLLSSRNNRVLQDRRQRLPERTKIVKLNKDVVLRRMDNVKAAPQERASAKVEFTSSKPAFKQRAKSNLAKGGPASIRFSSDTSTRRDVNAGTRQQQRRGQGLRSRAKSVVEKAANEDQNCNPNVPLNKATSRSRPLNGSFSEKIKARERDKRKQERMERDLNSLLSQHNSKVQNKRRGRT